MSGYMHNENRCPFDIWAPDHRCLINNKVFSAYTFRQQQIEDVINYLAAADDPDNFPTQLAAYEAANLDSDTLTDDEIDYMVKEIEIRKRM